MSTEKFANDASSTLNGSINSIVTSLIVTSATPFPSAGQFRIRIDLEILLVTGVSGTTFTVTRGIEGTTAASHANGAVVAHIITAGSLDEFRSNNITVQNYSSLPSVFKDGILHFVQDGIHVFRDNGVTLNTFGNLESQTIPPLISDFTWDNQDSATGVDNSGTVYVSATCNSVNYITALYKTAPATPWTLIAKILPDTAMQNYSGYGLCFRESSSGKIHSLELIWASKPCFFSRKYTNSTSFSSDYVADQPQRFVPWLKISDDGTDRKFWVSADSINWKLLHTVGRTDFLTADQIGFVLPRELGGGLTAAVNAISLVSWDVS